jgi:hypothetical protein
MVNNQASIQSGRREYSLTLVRSLRLVQTRAGLLASAHEIASLSSSHLIYAN